MNKIKLIALDIDGTLLDGNSEVSKANREAILQAEKKGIYVILATGRMYRSANQFSKYFNSDMPIITYNGGMVREFNYGKKLFEYNMPTDMVRPIYETTKKYDLSMNFYINDNLYANEGHKYIKDYAEHIKVPYLTLKDEEIFKLIDEENIIKMVAVEDSEVLDRFLAAEYDKYKDKLYLVKSLPFFLEIAHKGINKATGLKALGEILDIKPEEMLAIGDNLNDEEMLDFVGHPIVMANGHIELKNKGYFVTKTNEEDGVAFAISQFI